MDDYLVYDEAKIVEGEKKGRRTALWPIVESDIGIGESGEW